MKYPSLASMVLLASLTACPDGGGDGDGDGDGDACDVTSEIILDDLGAYSTALAVADDRVAYVTRVDAGTPTQLHVIGIDGTGEAVIYTSTTGRAIESLIWVGGDLVFLEAADGEPASSLFRVPASGGPPVQVGTSEFSVVPRIIGAADGAVFILHRNPVATLNRVDLSSGDVEVVGTVPDSGTPLHPVFADGEVFFAAFSGDVERVYRLSITDTDAEAQAVYATADAAGCGAGLGGIAATPTKLVCGFDDVVTFDRADGSMMELIVDGGIGSAAHIVVGSDGETIFTMQINDGTFASRLDEVNSAGGDVTPIACDVGKVAWQTFDGFFPIQVEYQVGIGQNDVVWAQEAFVDGMADPIVSLRRAPK